MAPTSTSRLFDLACFNLSYLSAWYLNTGHVQGRVPRSGHPSLTPCQLYRTRDGWIFLMCNKEKFWPILCEADRPGGMGRRSALRQLQGAAGTPRG